MVALSNREAQGRTPHDGRDAAEGEHHHHRANSSVSAGTGDARTGADKSKLHGRERTSSSNLFPQRQRRGRSWMGEKDSRLRGRWTPIPILGSWRWEEG